MNFHRYRYGHSNGDMYEKLIHDIGKQILNGNILNYGNKHLHTNHNLHTRDPAYPSVF
jgi:hypothetical protein